LKRYLAALQRMRSRVLLLLMLLAVTSVWPALGVFLAKAVR